MARQQYKTTPYVKHLEVFNDFSGGLNTVTTNDRLRTNELPDISNMDLGERGSLKRRAGMVTHLTNPVSGTAQGYFRYYTGSSYKEILAINGKFYINGTEQPGVVFQITKPIEGVQFGDKMYFATGSGLVQYDGTTFKLVEPHKPEPLEALYIGTNGLADDPDNFMQDGVGTFLRLDGVTFDKRYGILNQDFTLTAYSTIPAGQSVHYMFEWRTPFMDEGMWNEGQAWSSSKTWTYRANFEGDMQFRVSAKLSNGTVAEVQYLVPKYKIKAAPDPNDVAVNTNYIKQCNRILLHWNRLVLYGDPQNPDTIYISHLNKPDYFPVPNSLRFLNPQREGLTALVPFRDMLVAFTPTSIQALYGKSPSDYRRVMLNTSLGCIAPYSAVVVKNYVMFLSQEGVHVLKSLGYVEDKANVEKVDKNVDNIILRDPSACAAFHDGQYHIVFPNANVRLRLYTDTGVWTKDESARFQFRRMFVFGDKLFGQSPYTGTVYTFLSIQSDDAGVPFTDSFETRNFDFGQPYHKKKLKEVQILISPKEENIKANVYVYADSALVLSPDESKAVVDDNGNVVWQTDVKPNLVAYTGAKMGSWELSHNPLGEVDTVVQKLQVSGNCFRTRLKIENSRHILGFSYIFKLKEN